MTTPRGAALLHPDNGSVTDVILKPRSVGLRKMPGPPDWRRTKSSATERWAELITTRTMPATHTSSPCRLR